MGTRVTQPHCSSQADSMVDIAELHDAICIGSRLYVGSLHDPAPSAQTQARLVRQSEVWLLLLPDLNLHVMLYPYITPMLYTQGQRAHYASPSFLSITLRSISVHSCFCFKTYHESGLQGGLLLPVRYPRRPLCAGALEPALPLLPARCHLLLHDLHNILVLQGVCQPAPAQTLLVSGCSNDHHHTCQVDGAHILPDCTHG